MGTDIMCASCTYLNRSVSSQAPFKYQDIFETELSGQSNTNESESPVARPLLSAVKHECDVCRKVFNSKARLKDHKRIHSGERPFECDICQRRFIQLSHLRHHLRIHTGERPYQWSICNIRFTQMSTLNQHRTIHTEEHPFQCDICRQIFTRKSSLNKHKLRHTR